MKQQISEIYKKQNDTTAEVLYYKIGVIKWELYNVLMNIIMYQKFYL